MSSSMRLYSTTSNRNHTIVDPARSPADKFLFLHSSISATGKLTKLTSQKDINNGRKGVDDIYI